MLYDRGNADEKAYCERAVEYPAPVLIAQGSQQKEEEHQVQPCPHAAHALEVAKEAVRWRRGENRGDGCDSQKRQQREKDRLTAKVELLPAKTECQDERGCSDLDYHAEIEVPRNDVGEKEVCWSDDGNEE